MSESVALEARVVAVEKDIAELKDRIQGGAGTSPWYERTIGSMKDYPEFAEVVRLGRQIRKAESDGADPAE